MNLRKEQLLGLIRHTLTFVGGVLVVKGYLSEDMLTEVIAGIVSSTGVIWSIFSKK